MTISIILMLMILFLYNTFSYVVLLVMLEKRALPPAVEKLARLYDRYDNTTGGTPASTEVARLVFPAVFWPITFMIMIIDTFRRRRRSSN